jgi:hypothetical protein
MTLILDGYTAGLGGAIWLAGATLGVLTILAPWALGASLIWRTWNTLRTTQPAWRIRTWRTTRRLRRRILRAPE